MSKYRMQWTKDEPHIEIARSRNYSDIREAIERLANGTSPQPYMVIKTQSANKARKLGASVSYYLGRHDLRNVVGYTTRLNKQSDNGTVVIWNKQSTTPSFSA